MDVERAARRANTARRGRGRPRRTGAIEILTQEPNEERVAILTRCLASVLGTTFVAAVGLSLAGLAGTVAGWLALLAAAGAGMAPLGWYWYRARHPGRLPVWELDPRLARLVAGAAAEADALRRLADRAPVGPIAEHLDHLATTAHGYVVALHTSALQAAVRAPGTGGHDPELEATATRIVGQLADLAAAAGRLREAQSRRLQVSPLEELTAATDRLTAVIDGADRP